jgi:peptidoglycan/LPS O-acetylase OafA/YrhL
LQINLNCVQTTTRSPREWTEEASLFKRLGTTIAVPFAKSIAIRPSTSISNLPQARGYRPELDGVRFLAFLLVFSSHSIAAFSSRSEQAKGFLATFGAGSWHFLMLIDETCAMGLCLFFTLSAYLITNLLLTERETNGVISVRKFYIRRALRIWPLYWFGIALGMGLALASHRSGEITNFVWYLAFAGNIVVAAFGGFPNPMMILWSISIEEQFYLVWPWAMRWFSKRGLMLSALLFIVVANITLYVLASHHAQTDTTVWANTFVQFQMFGTGILLALATRRITWRHAGIGSLLVLIGPILWLIACSHFYAKQPVGMGPPVISGKSLMIGYGLIALGCATILQGFCMIGPTRMPRWAANQGKISYGLYVFHQLALAIAIGWCNRLHGFLFPLAMVMVALLLAEGAARLSYDYLELPFLRIKRRFEILHSRSL